MKHDQCSGMSFFYIIWLIFKINLPISGPNGTLAIVTCVHTFGLSEAYVEELVHLSK